jgi:hypothetical protein
MLERYFVKPVHALERGRHCRLVSRQSRLRQPSPEDQYGGTMPPC